MSGVEIRVTSDSTQARRDLSNLEKSVKGIESTVNNVTKAFAVLASSVAAAASVKAFTNNINNATDAVTSLENRIALVTGRGEALNKQLDTLYTIAQRTRQPIDAAAETFNRFGRALQGSGKSIEEINKAVESIGYAGAISGGSVESLRAALFQLGQGLASGQLRGQELNSVLEQAPRIAQAIADSLGEPRGKLKELAEAGKITTEVVFNALIDQADVLAKEFEVVQETSDVALSKLGTSIQRVTAQISKEIGFTEGYIRRINAVTGYINDNRTAIVASVVNFANNFKSSLAGVVAVGRGILNIFDAIAERAVKALPRVTIPLRTLSQEVEAFGKITLLNLNKFIKTFGLDFEAAVKSVLDLGFAGIFRDLFNSKSIKEFGDALYNAGEVLRVYGNRWYNLSNQQEKFIRSTRKFLLETGIYLGIIDQKLVRLRYTSFERFSKAFGVISDSLNEIKRNIVVSDLFLKFQAIVIKTQQFLVQFAKAVDNAFGNNISKGLLTFVNTFKLIRSEIQTYLQPAVNFISKALDEVERKFFWVYDQVIGNSWWTDTMEGVYDLASEWLSKSLNVVKSFANKVSDLYRYIKEVWTSNLDTNSKIELTVIGLDFSIAKYKAAIVRFAKALSESISENISIGLNSLKSVSPEIAGAIALATVAGITAALAPAVFAATFARLGPLFGAALTVGLADYFSKAIFDSNLIQLTAKGLGDAIGNAIRSFYNAIPDIVTGLITGAVEFGRALEEQLRGSLIGLPATILRAVTPFGGGGLLTTIFYGTAGAAIFSKTIRGFIFGQVIGPIFTQIAQRRGRGLLYNLLVGSNPRELVGGIEQQLTQVRGAAIQSMSKAGRKTALRNLRRDAQEQAEILARQNRLLGLRSLASIAGVIVGVEALVGDFIGTGNALVLGAGLSFLERATIGPNGGRSITQGIARVNTALQTVVSLLSGAWARALTVASGLLTVFRNVNLFTAAGITQIWTTTMNGLNIIFGQRLAGILKFAGLIGLISVAFAGFASASTSAAGEVMTNNLLMQVAFTTLAVGAIKNFSKIKNAMQAFLLYTASFSTTLAGILAFTLKSLTAPLAAASAVLGVFSKLSGLISASGAAVLGAVAGLGKALTNMFKGAILASVMQYGLFLDTIKTRFAAMMVALQTRFAAASAIMGAASGSAFAAAFASGIAIAIGLAIGAAIALGFDQVFNDGALTRKILKWLKGIFIQAGEFVGIGLNVKDLRNNLEEELAQAEKRFKSIGLNVRIEALLTDQSLSGLSARQKGQLDRSAEKLNKLSLTAIQEVAQQGGITNETMQAIDKELKLQTDILRRGQDPGQFAEGFKSDFNEIILSTRGFFTQLGDSTGLARFSSDFKLFSEQINRINTSGLEDPATAAASANAFANALAGILTSGLLPASTDTLNRLILAFERIATQGLFTGADKDLINELLKDLKAESGAAPNDILEAIRRVSGTRLSDEQITELENLAEAQANVARLNTEFVALENRLKTTITDLPEGFRSQVDVNERSRLNTLANRLEIAQRKLDLATLRVQPAKREEVNFVNDAQLGKINIQELASTVKALRDQLRYSVELAMTEGTKNFAERGTLSKILDTANITPLEFGALINLDSLDNVAQTIAARFSIEAETLDKLYQDILETRSKDFDNEADNEAQRSAAIVAATNLYEAQKGKVEDLVNQLNILNVRDVERVGLLQDAVSGFDKFNINFDKLLAISPETINKIIQAQAAIALLQARLRSALLSGNKGDAAALTAQIEAYLKTISDAFNSNRSSIEAAGSGGQTAWEKFTGSMSSMGFDFGINDTLGLTQSAMSKLIGYAKEYEAAQKRVNKLGVNDLENRQKIAQQMKDIADKVAQTLSGTTLGNVSKVLESVGGPSLEDILSNPSANLKEILANTTRLRDIESEIAQLTADQIDKARELIKEARERRKNIEELTIGQEVADGFKNDFERGFAEALKTGDFKAFGEMLLDSFTNSIIDTFAKGITEGLFGENGLLGGLFQSIFSWSKGIGKTVVGAAESGTQQGASLTDLFSGIGNFFKTIFKGLFKFIGALFGGGGAMHAGGVVQKRAAGGLINPGIGQAGKDSVPVMLTPGEYVSPSQRAAELFKANSNKPSQQTVVNLNVTGDISRQTKKEVLKLIPQIASGVNGVNRERTS